MSVYTPALEVVSQIIGPVCVDENVDASGNTQHVVGGAAICAAAAAASLGHTVQSVLSLASSDTHLLDQAPALINPIVKVLGEHTSSIRNVYATADQERRTSYALAQAEPITSADVPVIAPKVAHLAGLVIGDYHPDLLGQLATRGALAVDMQGFVRKAEPDNGLLHLISRPDMEQVMPLVTFLKVDTAEGERLTGLTDRAEIARRLHALGAREVMVSNAKEILVFDDAGIHTCPLRARSLVGRTGRGDTVFSAYITERTHLGVDAALLNACATVSFKMETPGPLVSTRAQILAYRDRFYADLVAQTAGVDAASLEQR